MAGRVGHQRLRGNRGCANGILSGPHTVEDGLSVRQEDVACFRERHTTRVSHEEQRSQFVFETADLSAYCRLRDPECARRSPDVPLSRNGYEVLDLREAHRFDFTRGRGHSQHRWIIGRIDDRWT